MFDRFTSNARKAMNAAKSEADRLQHQRINTEHILLGVIQADGSRAHEALRHFDLPAEVVALAIRGAMDAQRDDELRGTRARLRPFAREAKRVLELGLELASELGHNYIGTAHLLLGLLGEEGKERGLGGQVLRELGLERDVVAGVVANLEKSRSGGATSGRGCSLIAAVPIFCIWIALLVATAR